MPQSHPLSWNTPKTVGRWVWVGLAVAIIAFLWDLDAQAAAISGQSRHINAERLQANLEKLSEFG